MIVFLSARIWPALAAFFGQAPGPGRAPGRGRL